MSTGPSQPIPRVIPLKNEKCAKGIPLNCGKGLKPRVGHGVTCTSICSFSQAAVGPETSVAARRTFGCSSEEKTTRYPPSNTATMKIKSLILQTYGEVSPLKLLFLRITQNSYSFTMPAYCVVISCSSPCTLASSMLIELEKHSLYFQAS